MKNRKDNKPVNQNQKSFFFEDFLETNQMKHKKIGIHDGELKMHEKKEYSPLSFTFLEEHLGKIVSDENQLHAILAYLKENREIKVSNELKRTYKTK